MLRTQTQRKSLFWSTLLAAAVVTTAAPGEAQAGRQLTRRTLPNGAQAPSAVQTSDASDPAVETGITRLLAASAGSGPTRAAAGTTVEGQGAHLTRSRGGYVRALVAPPGGGWTVARPGSDRTPEGLALAFLREHRVALGLSKRAVTFQSTALRRAPGQSYVRLAQRFAGLPVFAASVVVQVEESGRVGYVLSDIARDDADLHTPGFSVQASIDGSAAATTALGVVPLDRQVGLETDAPELTVYEPSVIGSAGPSRLVWHVRVRNASGDVNEVVLVDAVSGDVAFHYSDVKHAKSRSIYDARERLRLARHPRPERGWPRQWHRRRQPRLRLPRRHLRLLLHPLRAGQLRRLGRAPRGPRALLRAVRGAAPTRTPTGTGRRCGSGRASRPPTTSWRTSSPTR